MGVCNSLKIKQTRKTDQSSTKCCFDQRFNYQRRPSHTIAMGTNRIGLKPLFISSIGVYNSQHHQHTMINNDRNRIDSFRKENHDYCNNFQHRHQNQNHLLRHLVNSLNRDAFQGYDNLNQKIYNNNQNGFIDWEYITNANGTMNYWKPITKVYRKPEEINRIIGLSIEEIAQESFLHKRIWLNNHLTVALNKKQICLDNCINPILIISRENILEESFNQFMTTKDLNYFQKIQIHFIDEVAQDIGGVYQEWYTCIMKEFFNPINSLFTIDNCSSSIVISDNFLDNNQIIYYEFFGKLLAKGLLDKITIPQNLNRILIKQLLKIPLILDDIKYIDKQLYESLLYLQKNTINEQSSLDMFFTWNIRSKDKNTSILEQIDLIPNGSTINVTDSNKEDFILKVIEYEFNAKYQEKIDLILRGFYQFIPLDHMKILSIEEFDFILSGQKAIDIDDWIKNTIYKGEYNSTHDTIIMFWEIIRKLPQEDLLAFFHFCTGRTRVPIDGFGSLMGPHNQIQKFTIDLSHKKKSDSFRLIEAKTCFNRIYLPNYLSSQDMNKAIMIIINNDTNFFGLE